jgi:hypothetical protein
MDPRSGSHPSNKPCSILEFPDLGGKGEAQLSNLNNRQEQAEIHRLSPGIGLAHGLKIGANSEAHGDDRDVVVAVVFIGQIDQLMDALL